MKIEIDQETIELILDGLRNKIQFLQKEIRHYEIEVGTNAQRYEDLERKYKELIYKLPPLEQKHYERHEGALMSIDLLFDMNTESKNQTEKLVNAIKAFRSDNMGIEEFEKILSEVALTEEEEKIIQPDESTRNNEPTYGDVL